MKRHTGNNELEKSKGHIIREIIEYIPNKVLSKTIITKPTGNITFTSIDAGYEKTEQTSPFDAFIQIIDGSAEVVINGNKYTLGPGEGIIIPAHITHCFYAKVRFKMITTVIKSGYED